MIDPRLDSLTTGDQIIMTDPLPEVTEQLDSLKWRGYDFTVSRLETRYLVTCTKRPTGTERT
jgi:hypothetical protein